MRSHQVWPRLATVIKLSLKNDGVKVSRTVLLNKKYFDLLRRGVAVCSNVAKSYKFVFNITL